MAWLANEAGMFGFLVCPDGDTERNAGQRGGAFRRSELVGFDVADLAWTADGLVVTIRHSKTDQEGAGTKVGLPYGRLPETCPVRRLRA